VLTQYKTVSIDLVEQIIISCGGVFKNSTESFIKARHPDFYDTLRKISPKMYNGALHLVLWEANRMYREHTISSFSDVKLALFGDDYWPKLVSVISGNYKFFPEFSYYEDTLESLYRTSKISFNCSSAQMANAVNQRVFDVPASCGFLLTDYRAQIADLFDPGREIATYRCIEELNEMIKKYLSDRQEANRITHAARKRILHEHTYVHRVQSMLRSLDIS
jgi:spore maturation protein CgeB